jgi:hypothetical protein
MHAGLASLPRQRALRVFARAEHTDPALDAAGKEYAVAFNNICAFIEDLPRYEAESRDGKLHDLHANLRHAYNQRTLISSFGIAYEFLKQHGENGDQRQALEWLAEQAAQVGSADGHVALADFATTDAEKWFHLQLAANLMDMDKGDRHAEADALRTRAVDIKLADDEIQRQQQRVQSWMPEDPLINLPPDILQRLTEASQRSGGR